MYMIVYVFMYVNTMNDYDHSNMAYIMITSMYAQDQEQSQSHETDDNPPSICMLDARLSLLL